MSIFRHLGEAYAEAASLYSKNISEQWVEEESSVGIDRLNWTRSGLASHLGES